MELSENMVEHFPQLDDTFIGSLKRPFSWLLSAGTVQFQYHDGMIFAVDQGGFILTRQNFEEIVSYWRKFYDTFSDEEIEYINQNKHLYKQTYQIPDKLSNQNTSGMVYILSGDGVYKIGKTTNIKARLSQLTPKLPFKVKLIHTIETDNIDILEEELHEYYAGKRANGEWFELDPMDVDFIKSIKSFVDGQFVGADGGRIQLPMGH